jgi:hypothetical protein
MKKCCRYKTGHYRQITGVIKFCMCEMVFQFPHNGNAGTIHVSNYIVQNFGKLQVQILNSKDCR